MKLQNCLFIVLTFIVHFSFAQSKDVLKVTTHKLDNGFTIFLNEDSTATKVFGAVMVKAGAVNEDEDATGMAHYLEHLLFKGTEKMGTSNYEKEKPLLDSISHLYEELAKELNKDEQLKIQKRINGLAVRSSKYGLPNEFDKLLKSIGGTNINAFTSYDMTFYHNLFPAHEIEKWLDLYAARFDHPVFRSFQSELEVVYEEKNRAMDEMGGRLMEEFNKSNFPNLPYGKWSVLGTIEHLKKPSLMKMQAFYDKHYVAKNMALILTGNFKKGEVLPLIAEKFKNLSDKEAPVLKLPQLQPLTGNPVTKIRDTPIKVEILGWQTVASNHKDRFALDVFQTILSNGSTGLLDQLSENNEIMFVSGMSAQYNRAGAFSIMAVPKPFIQSISNAEKKIEGVLTKLKNGNFSLDLFNASKYELSKQFQQNMEQLNGRAISIGEAFSQGVSWVDYSSYPEKINQVTKEDVMRVAKKYFGKQRYKIISRTGFPKKLKLDKPPFKAVSRTQEDSSVYAKKFKDIPSQPFQPKFIDFENDVEKTTIYHDQSLTKTTNPVNNLFYLKIQFKKGSFNNEKLKAGVNLMNYSGAGKYSYTELKQAFSNIGCSYDFSCGYNYTTLRVDGAENDLSAAVKLIQLLLKDPNEDVKGLPLMLKEIKLNRKADKMDRSLLSKALFNYAVNKDKSAFILRPSKQEMKKMIRPELIAFYKEVVNDYNFEVSYVGSQPIEKVKQILEDEIDLFANSKEEPYVVRERDIISKNRVLVINDKKAIQTQIYFYIPDNERDLSDYIKIKAFNNYFSGGFSGIITQEIREYRSLAYSVGGSYVLPVKSNGYFFSYIGCQADKTTEAITVLDSLLNDMPQRQDRINALKKSLKQRTVSSYPNFRHLYAYISYYQKLGFKNDPGINAYRKYDDLNMEDITDFYEKSIKGKPRVITIYGNKNKIDLDALKKFGEIEFLKPKDVITF